MKVFAITALLMAICTLPFSCTNKEDTPSNGSVVFWTNNAAKLTACSNSMLIRVTETLSGVFISNATITSLSATAPSGCVGVASVSGLVPGTQYLGTVNACAAGGSGVSFSVSPGECLKLQIL